jgi:phthalate 4,5-dioxygenase oxygenase subunit
MLTREENELLCKVGRKKPMGQMLRRYWIPAAASTDLISDGPPRPVRLLGENLIAFRDTNGNVGILDESCPHRGTSLVLARNEECGLRCLYHGWKISTDGRILDTPAEPQDPNFKSRVRATAYPVYEAGGFVWTYLGPAGTEPPHPDFAFTAVPDTNRMILTARIEANFMQCIEGVIDSAHSNYLHRSKAMLDRPSTDGAPEIAVQNTSYGFRYGAIRIPKADPEGSRYVRVTLFVAPFHALFPQPPGWNALQMFVPIDSKTTMFHFVRWSANPIDEAERERTYIWSGTRRGVDVDDDYRKTRTPENIWMQDRGRMRAGSFSGITGVNNEDFAVQESMGPIYDRRKEHLGTSDIAVIRMRRLMLDSVRAFTADGTPPLGLRDSVPYARLRAEDKVIPTGVAWQTVGAFAGEPVAVV